MTNEPSWLRIYIEDLSREAGLTEPTEAYQDNCLYGVSFEFEGKRVDSAEVYLAAPTEAWKAQIEAMVFPVHSEVDPSNSGPIRIDEMTLADYRRGVANMKTRYV